MGGSSVIWVSCFFLREAFSFQSKSLHLCVCVYVYVRVVSINLATESSSFSIFRLVRNAQNRAKARCNNVCCLQHSCQRSLLRSWLPANQADLCSLRRANARSDEHRNREREILARLAAHRASAT